MSQTAASLNVHIRWMIRRDMAEVLEIEAASHECPWSEDEFLRTLRKRNVIGMIAEHGDRVAGFMVYALHRGSLEILKFAVAPEYRRRGVGRRMIDKLKRKLSDHRSRLHCHARETELMGQLFLRSQGFLATRVHREHFENGEDAYEMGYEEPVRSE